MILLVSLSVLGYENIQTQRNDDIDNVLRELSVPADVIVLWV